MSETTHIGRNKMLHLCNHKTYRHVKSLRLKSKNQILVLRDFDMYKLTFITENYSFNETIFI